MTTRSLRMSSKHLNSASHFVSPATLASLPVRMSGNCYAYSIISWFPKKVVLVLWCHWHASAQKITKAIFWAVWKMLAFQTACSACAISTSQAKWHYRKKSCPVWERPGVLVLYKQKNNMYVLSASPIGIWNAPNCLSYCHCYWILRCLTVSTYMIDGQEFGWVGKPS